MRVHNRDKKKVEAVIHRWKAAFAARDSEALKCLWDRDYPQLLYIGEGWNDPFLGWAAIGGYLDSVSSGWEILEWNLGDLVVDVLGELAYAYCTFVIVGKGSAQGLGRRQIFEGRDTFLLCRKGDEWKIIHLHESLSRDRSHDAWGFLWI